MKNTNLKLITNEVKTPKRVLPGQIPKPLNPMKFDEDPKHLIDFTNKGLKWFTSIIKYL